MDSQGLKKVLLSPDGGLNKALLTPQKGLICPPLACFTPSVFLQTHTSGQQRRRDHRKKKKPKSCQGRRRCTVTRATSADEDSQAHSSQQPARKAWRPLWEPNHSHAACLEAMKVLERLHVFSSCNRCWPIRRGKGTGCWIKPEKRHLCTIQAKYISSSSRAHDHKLHFHIKILQ